MRGYKAFDKGLICRKKQYAENTVFEEDNAEICRKGMHFCENPLDTLDYYPLIDNAGNVIEFAEVEALDEVKTDNNKKFCTKKLKIGKKLSLSQFIKASFDTLYQKIKSQDTAEISDNTNITDGNNEILVGRHCAKLAGGNGAILAGGNAATLVGNNFAKITGGQRTTLIGGYGAALSGDANTKIVGGNCAKLVGGIYATIIGGNCATLAGGKFAKLLGGTFAKLIGGKFTKLVGGDYAKLLGDCGSTLAGGNNSIIVGDNRSEAKGKKGSLIVLVERDENLNIINFKAVQVDGKKIKEDVLYRLEDGELVEVKI